MVRTYLAFSEPQTIHQNSTILYSQQEWIIIAPVYPHPTLFDVISVLNTILLNQTCYCISTFNMHLTYLHVAEDVFPCALYQMFKSNV